MKELKKVFLLLVSVIILVSSITISSSAADYKSAEKLTANKSISLKGSTTSVSQGYYKFILPDAGKVKFYGTAAKYTNTDKFEFLSSSGKALLSGKLSELTTKTRSFNQKGTYYLKLTLSKGQTVMGFYYNFISNSGKKVTKNITVDENKSYDLSGYVKGFSGNIKWLSSNNTVAKISSNGILRTVKAGNAIIYAYSANGDYATINITAKASKISGTNWIKNYVFTQNDLDDFKRILGFFIVWNSAEYKENQLSESDAIDLLVAPVSPVILILPEYGDYHGETFSFQIIDGFPAELKYKASVIDNTIYSLFGIKATHNNTSGKHFRYKDGYYYFPYPAAGGGGIGYVVSTEYMSDGKSLIEYHYDIMDPRGEIFDSIHCYILLSISEENEQKYFRFHSICKNRSDALSGY